jgi:hypothetical protein
MQTNNPEERLNTKELLEISFENENGLLNKVWNDYQKSFVY